MYSPNGTKAKGQKESRQAIYQ